MAVSLLWCPGHYWPCFISCWINSVRYIIKKLFNHWCKYVRYICCYALGLRGWQAPAQAHVFLPTMLWFPPIWIKVMSDVFVYEWQVAQQHRQFNSRLLLFWSKFWNVRRAIFFIMNASQSVQTVLTLIVLIMFSSEYYVSSNSGCRMGRLMVNLSLVK